MGKLFGTDGIRGVVGETLTAELAYRVGQAITIVLTEQKGSAPHHHHRQGHPHFIRYAGVGAHGRHLRYGRQRYALWHHPHPGGGIPYGAGGGGCRHCHFRVSQPL